MRFQYLVLVAALLTAPVMAANTTLDGTSTSNASSMTTSGAMNAGVSTSVSSYGAGLPQFTLALTTAVNYTPSPAASMSQANCAGFETKGGTFGPIAASDSKMVDGHECNGILNGQHLGQMAANARALGNAYLEEAKKSYVAKIFDRTEILSKQANILFARADALDRAHQNLFCRQDEIVYAVMKDQGLCDTIDYDQYKREFKAPTDGRPVPRTDAMAEFPMTGG